MDAGPFEGRLLPGERMLWTGRPGGGLLFTARDVFLIPFSLLWFGFAVFWTSMAMKPGAPAFFYVIGIFAVCMGLFFVVGRFLVDMWVRSQTAYGITEQRVLILREGPLRNFTSINRDTLPEVHLVEGDEGEGTLRFGHATPQYPNSRVMVMMPSLDPTPQFLKVADAAQVLALILQPRPRAVAVAPSSPDMWRRPEDRQSVVVETHAEPESTAAPTPPPVTVAFRKPALWTPAMTANVIVMIVVATIGVATTVPRAALVNRTFLGFMALYFAVVIAVVIGAFVLRRLYVRAKGGVPPITFATSYLEMPVTANSLRLVTRIDYADVLSTSVFGKGWSGRLIVDTRKRTFVYPTAQFAEADAAQRIAETLRARILARPDGNGLWAEMEKRRALAERFVAIRPVATWIALAAIAVVYLLQLVTVRDEDLFGLVTMGANASGLVLAGEWYRLATANLLHANTLHFLSNAFSLWIIGMVVERQLGLARFVIVMLASGILSQLASAGYVTLIPTHLYSVGVSGVVFGLLGAQAVLNHRFGSQLPGGYRFVARAWVVLLVLNFVLVPILVPQIDIAAHVGGLAAGAALCWLLCRTQADIATRERSVLAAVAAAALAAVWLGSAALVAVRANDPAAIAADKTKLLIAMGTRSAFTPDMDNAVAWSVAMDPRATSQQIDAAIPIASRAVKTATARNDRGKANIIDTLATLTARTGDLDAAIDLEAPLVAAPRTPFASRLAWLLDRRLQKAGDVREVPFQPNVLLPQVSVARGRGGDVAIDVSLGTALPNGAEMWVLLRKNNALVGLVWIAIESTYEPRIRLRRNGSGPHPLAEQIDAGAEMVLAQVNTTRCNCTEREARYFAYDPKVPQPPVN